MSLVPTITLHDTQGTHWQMGKAKDQAFKRCPKVLEMLSGELWTVSCSSSRALVRGLALREQALGAECSALWAWPPAPHLVMWLGQPVTYPGSLVHHLKMRPSQQCSEVTLSQEFSEGKTSTQQGLRCQASCVDRCWELSFTREVCAQASAPHLPDPYYHPTMEGILGIPFPINEENSGREMKQWLESSRWDQGWNPGSPGARPWLPATTHCHSHTATAAEAEKQGTEARAWAKWK